MKWLEILKSKIQLWNKYHNPLYPWYKVRKIFKRPKSHFIYGKDIWFYGMISSKYYNPILHIYTSSLGWKSKYEDYRHEWDPFIDICFFRKYHLIWVFNWAKKNNSDSGFISDSTWEAIMDFLYKNLSIEECIKRNTLIDMDDNKITIKENLKIH